MSTDMFPDAAVDYIVKANDFQDAAKSALRQMVANARQAILTEPRHAISTHRADEWMRDTLEEILHEEVPT